MSYISVALRRAVIARAANHGSLRYRAGNGEGSQDEPPHDARYSSRRACDWTTSAVRFALKKWILMTEVQITPIASEEQGQTALEERDAVDDMRTAFAVGAADSSYFLAGGHSRMAGTIADLAEGRRRRLGSIGRGSRGTPRVYGA